MRVCEAHREKSVQTLRSIRDDAEFDLCETCYEAFMLLVSGALFMAPSEGTEPEPVKPKRGRAPKEQEPLLG